MFSFEMRELGLKYESELFKKAQAMEKVSAEYKELDKPIGNFVVDAEKVAGCPIEGHNGHWDGTRGNSLWRPDVNEKPLRYNPEDRTWGEILKEYKIEGIEYNNGDPNFKEIAKGIVEIDDFTDDRESNFAQADEALAKQRGCLPQEVKQWRLNNGYTWHECRDCRTIQKVPRGVHNNMDHSGGISEYKKNNRVDGDMT